MSITSLNGYPDLDGGLTLSMIPTLTSKPLNNQVLYQKDSSRDWGSARKMARSDFKLTQSVLEGGVVTFVGKYYREYFNLLSVEVTFFIHISVNVNLLFDQCVVD